MEGCAASGVNVRRRGVCVIVDNEVGSFFGFVMNMLCSVSLLFFTSFCLSVVLSNVLCISLRVKLQTRLYQCICVHFLLKAILYKFLII